MKLKPVINIKCPCCSQILEIDVGKERVVSHRRGRHLRDDAEGGEDAMDVAFRQHSELKEGAEERFLSAQDKLRGQADRLDDIFKKATRKAKKDIEEGLDDDTPRKIWD